MEEITDAKEVKQWIVEKQALEVALAMDLLEIFNDYGAGLIQKIRSMIASSVDDMDLKRERNIHNFDRLWGADWSKNYAACVDNGITGWDRDGIKDKVANFKAEHCSDWIRIYGEVIEKVTPGPENVKRESYQKGGRYHWTKYNEAADAVKKDPVQAQAGRRRLTKLDGYEARQTEAWRLMSGTHDKEVGKEFHEKSGWKSAGLGRWKVMDKDTTGKMDQVFGLSPGATISGTTTDNIYFLDKFSKMRADPIYYLLPTATIVGKGHHTMLEVALPLSLNNLCEYQVGLYSTLFPKRGALPEAPSGVREIRTLLQKYENHRDNRLMLVYYSAPGEPAGCFVYEVTGDRDKWAAFAKAGEAQMQKFKSLSPWPNRMRLLTIPYR